MDQPMARETNRAGCLAKGAAYAGPIGPDLLQLAKRARAEGKIRAVDRAKLLR